MGFHVEAAHHEVAPGQHEIDFRYDDALTTADNVSTFRFVVKNVALSNGLHATFMPKPIFGVNGSGMHTHQSLFAGRQERVLRSAERRWQLSQTCLHYIGGSAAARQGLLRDHQSARELVQAARARATRRRRRSRGRSGIAVRSCACPRRAASTTRIELRMPDPSCNPYLALAVMLRAGLDGIDQTDSIPARR